MTNPDDEIQVEYRNMMQHLARELDRLFNPGFFNDEIPQKSAGFVLMVFPFGEVEGGRFNYISNGADRKDIVCLMKEMIARFEGQPEQKGTA